MPKKSPPWPRQVPIGELPEAWPPAPVDTPAEDATRAVAPPTRLSEAQFVALVEGPLGYDPDHVEAELDDALHAAESTYALHGEVLYFCLLSLQPLQRAVALEPERRAATQSALAAWKAEGEDPKSPLLIEARRQNPYRVPTPWGIVLNVPVDFTRGRPKAWPTEVGALVLGWLLRLAAVGDDKLVAALAFALMRLAGLTAARPEPERLVAEFNKLVRKALEWIPESHGPLAIPAELQSGG